MWFFNKSLNSLKKKPAYVRTFSTNIKTHQKVHKLILIKNVGLISGRFVLKISEISVELELYEIVEYYIFEHGMSKVRIPRNLQVEGSKSNLSVEDTIEPGEF